MSKLKKILLILVSVLVVLGGVGYGAFLYLTTTPYVEAMPRNTVTPDEPELVAKTANGDVLGKRLDNGIVQFGGIPIATPPVGDLRFMPPQPSANWDGVLDTREQGPRCMQQDNLFFGVWPGGQSEDCLWVKVNTPALDDKKRPVMVWIHGGGLTLGGAGEPTYEGATTAARGDVVHVGVQYRMGTFGFLDLSQFGPEFEQSAELGLLDQLLALKWVHENIEAFGGDPENVTIYGESAGSIAAARLATMPESEGLFHKMILMSGAYTPGDTKKVTQDGAKWFVEELGATSVDDIRALSAKEFLAAQKKLEDYAVTQGAPDLMALIEFEAPTEGAIRKLGERGIPLLHGTTTNEYHFFTLLEDDTPTRGRDIAHKYLGNLQGLSAEDIEKLKDITASSFPDEDEQDVYLNTLTWALMAHPHDRFQKIVAEAGAPVWQYNFDWKSPEFPELGAFHALDLPFTFGTLEDNAILVGKTPPAELSERFQDALIAFARTGDPNADSLPDWPRYDRATRPVMRFGDKVDLITGFNPSLDEFSERFENALPN
ncbi:carboxylesterase/lipase family protein [Ruegeria halocynthiae]|uniref:carboxylesterase/lipase family protein n=1 Tax=Ruegeria halocynthiae TaxID=985054 RepID=UPI00068F036A|nr:carboxylesterase family protein [Ruegeria halocynthiae]